MVRCRFAARRVGRATAALASHAAVAALAACHHAAQPIATMSVGEADRIGARIVRVAYPEATFELNTPAYMLAMSVVPGAGLTPIWTSEAPWDLGTHTTPVLVPQKSGGIRSDTRDELQACVERTIKAPTTRRVRRNTPRDANGRPTDGGPDYTEVEVGGVTQTQAQHICGSQVRTTTYRRPDAGYLVLFASTVPLSADELRGRLAKFKITAETLRDSMTAIGQGIYVDRDAVWSATYVHW